MIKFGLILSIFFLIGCASSSRNLVPLSDGSVINPKLQSATRTEQGVKVTVQSSAWRGTLNDLEQYVAPFYVVIQNDTARNLTFNYEDLALLNEKGTQYNPLPPETVAQILQAARSGRYGFRPAFSIGFGGFGDGFLSFFSIFFPALYSTPAPQRLDDVFTQALTPGIVYPKSKLQGFVYFKEIPDKIERVTLEISYKVQGEPERHKLSFPFALR
jgi:hypothetical protein